MSKAQSHQVSTITNRTILQGDVLDKLKEIPDGVIDTIISSPPYWGLRDYEVEGQLGLEPDFRDYLKTMQNIMDELKRVLKNTGSCWINLGDTYAGGIDFSRCGTSNESFYNASNKKFNLKLNLSNKLPSKSRYGIPERFYINCIDSGWIARNHIPWYKSNAMPSSVKDRFTNKWESIFFFVKEQKYYFNLDAVREKTITESKPFNIRVRETKKGFEQQKITGGMSEGEDQAYNKKGEIKGRYTNKKLNHRNGLGSSTLDKKQDSTLGPDGKPIPTYKEFNKRWKDTSNKGFDENGNCYGCGLPKAKHRNSRKKNKSYIERNTETIWEYVPCNPKGKNPGDVFFINPKPFAEAHFATFPVDLPLKILKCACPPNGIVFDPFFGAGTIAVAAEQLGLRWIGIELNEEYIKIAEKRLEKYQHEKLEEFL